MALTSLETRKCLMMLFPEPSWINTRTGAGIQGSHEAEAQTALAAIDVDQITIVRTILTAWDAALLDESSITATGANKGFSTSGKRARKLLREQLISAIQYMPQSTWFGSSQSGGAIGGRG